MSNNSPTFRLLRKKPSFLNGFASTINVFGCDESALRINKTEAEADSSSIESDWKAVGDDMRKAIKIVCQE